MTDQNTQLRSGGELEYPAGNSSESTPSKFLDWERRGIMPRPIHVDGCRLYDAEQIRIAWEALKDGSEPPAFDNSNPYDLA